MLSPLRRADTPGSPVPIARRPPPCSGRAWQHLAMLFDRQLVAQFQHHAFGGLLSDSRDSGEPREIVAPYRVDHLVSRHAAQNGDRKLRPDAAYGDQLLNSAFSLERRNP